MTREEAVACLKGIKILGKDIFTRCRYDLDNAVDMAIKALEQEPILDKIRAEIQNGTHHFLDGEPIIEIKEVLQIIDKYKAESEGKE